MLNLRTRCALGSLLALGMALAAQAQAPAPSWRLGVTTFSAKPNGVKIAEVAPNSPAAEVGLKPGWIILTLGGKLVNKPSEAQDAVYAAGDDIDVVYQDEAGGFFQIKAPLASVTFIQFMDGKNVQKEKLAPKGGKPTPKRVPDPRKK
jgi:S1-C subfamily serine protease